MYLADAFIFGLCRKSQGTHCLALAFCGAEGMRVLKSTQGLLATLRCRAIFLYPGTDTLSEWLRRWTRNPLGSARKGLNPLGVALLARYVAGVWKPLP